ncbi:hypothetical protein ACRAWD_24555 [Caulobacter segnis]
MLDEALAAFAGAKAVIVDVSNNRGGYDTIAASGSPPASPSSRAWPIRRSPSGPTGAAAAGAGRAGLPDAARQAGLSGDQRRHRQRRRDLHPDDEGAAQREAGRRDDARRFSDQLPKHLAQWLRSCALPAELYKGAGRTARTWRGGAWLPASPWRSSPGTEPDGRLRQGDPRAAGVKIREDAR